MRRDVCYCFDTDVKTLYNGYLTAVSNEPFGRDCKKEPYHTLTFGLNFSMKYNMNGGSCIMHFIPYNGGAAIDMRFVIAQGMGARYEKYAEDLKRYAEKVLGKSGSRTNIPIEMFTDPANKIDISAPAAAPAASADIAVCTGCGAALPEGANFCPKCGAKKTENKNRFCISCGSKAESDDKFCSKCGTRLVLS